MSAISYAGSPICPLAKGHSSSLTNGSRISPTRRRSSFSSISNSEHSLMRRARGLAEFCSVDKFDDAAGMLLFRINHTLVERTRVDVQAHGTFPEFRQIGNSMHGFLWIDRDRIAEAHFNRIAALNVAMANTDVFR